MLENDCWYSVADVARLLKLSRQTVHNLIKKKDLPYGRANRLIRINGAELNAWLRRHRKERKVG